MSTTVTAAMAFKAEESKNRIRASSRAVLEKDLEAIVKLQQLALQESPKTPRSTKKVIRSESHVLQTQDGLSSTFTDGLDCDSSASTYTIYVVTHVQVDYYRFLLWAFR